MNECAWLILYSALVLLFSLAGGSLPLLGRITHSRLQLYLSASAGVMLGACFFHVMPDAMEMAGPYFGWWMSLGVVGLFCIERFIAPHSHEIDNGDHHTHPHAEHGDHDAREHHHAPSCGHASRPARDMRAVAPPVAGWMAVLGLTIHTFMNGVGLAGAVQFDAEQRDRSTITAEAAPGVWLPGLALFLAIVLHKPADALAISTVLSRKGTSRRKLILVQLGFATMVPVGIVAYHATRGAITRDLQSQLTGAALAFSSGTFLFIALSDLLPEVQFHRHDRLPLFLALVLGVILMGGIALLEDHDHTKEGRSSPAENDAGKPNR